MQLENTETVLFGVHTEEECTGIICCIHDRTDHPMRSFPQHWRSDRRIMERTCPHGVGHPDPDDRRIVSGEDSGVHGCCGCCSGQPLDLQVVQ